MSGATSDWYLEDFVVGDVYRSIGRTVSEADLLTFVTQYGFMEELFLNAETAAASIFHRRVIPGPLVLVLAEGLYQMSGRMHNALAYLGLTDFRMDAPVACGDTVRVDVEVVEVRRTTAKNDRGIVTTVHRIRGREDAVVASYRSARMLRARPA